MTQNNYCVYNYICQILLMMNFDILQGYKNNVYAIFMCGSVSNPGGFQLQSSTFHPNLCRHCSELTSNPGSQTRTPNLFTTEEFSRACSKCSSHNVFFLSTSQQAKGTVSLSHPCYQGLTSKLHRYCTGSFVEMYFSMFSQKSRNLLQKIYLGL